MRNKKKLCAGILMLLLLTGCSSQEVLQEVPQTIVLPESQIDTMPVQETAAAENDNTESFSLLEEGGSRFAYESLDEQEQIWYQEIEQAIGSMDDTIKLSTEPLEQGMDEQDIDKVFQCVLIDHPEIFYTTGYTYTKYSRGGENRRNRLRRHLRSDEGRGRSAGGGHSQCDGGMAVRYGRGGF